MDDQRRSREREDKVPPAEGVRIIGPDEAAEAIERGDVTPRRGDDMPRYGDRPAGPPAGPRPALRFPLDASADPSRIERPPVQPAPDPVTGPVELPHWSEPPTGEVPAVLIGDDGPLLDDDEDVDAWSSFATSTPRWRDADDDWADDDFMTTLSDHSDEVRVGALADQDQEPSQEDYYGFEDLEQRVEERTTDLTDDARPRWEVDDDSWAASAEDDAPSAIDDDADAEDAWPNDEGWDDEPVDGDDLVDDDVLVGEHDEDLALDDEDDLADGDDDGYGREPAMAGGGGGDRDMTKAVAVGGGLGLVAIIAMILGAKFMVIVVTIALGVAAVEYFNVLRKVGWESATLLGVAACVAMPLAIYWRGPAYYSMLGFITLASILAWYLVGAGGREPRVLEGTGATMLGVVWIGGLGSTAAAMLAMHDGRALLLTSILATVAYDVGGLFIGKSMGHRPLSAASPNKTVEGLVGGMACAFLVVLALVGVKELGPWHGVAAALVLGLGAACAAPLGDLCQSLLKRDLGVKDMSDMLPGHGGVLDRFDSMLFVLPTVFWLAVTLGL